MRFDKLLIILCIGVFLFSCRKNNNEKINIIDNSITLKIYKGLDLIESGHMHEAQDLFFRTRMNRLNYLKSNVTKDQLFNAVNTFQIGMLYFGYTSTTGPNNESEKNYRKAIHYLEKCIKTKDFDNKLSYKAKAYTYYALGKSYLELVMLPVEILSTGEQEEALDKSLLYSQKALILFNKSDLKNRYLAMTYFNLASSHIMKKNYKSALLFAKKIEDISKGLHFSNKQRVLFFAKVIEVKALYFLNRKKEVFALVKKILPEVKEKFPDQKIAIERLTQWQKEYEATK